MLCRVYCLVSPLVCCCCQIKPSSVNGGFAYSSVPDLVPLLLTVTTLARCIHGLCPYPSLLHCCLAYQRLSSGADTCVQLLHFSFSCCVFIGCMACSFTWPPRFISQLNLAGFTLRGIWQAADI
eukprot:g71912.t1